MSAVIEVQHVTKEYQLGQLAGLGDGLRNTWRRVRGHPVLERPPFKALDDVSFSVQPGEVLGIIGHNGAGKSTLLKLLANISRPTRGQVCVKGRIAPLIEVGAGFVPEFTGRENVYLNASILGMSKAEIRRKFDEIVEFAEMAEFIDTPVKRYSSGMQVKLAFAVATSVEAEILIVDEVLAVGDLAFQRKCFDRVEELIHRQQRTVLLVSHNIRQVERLCSRVILLGKGRMLQDGQSEDVCRSFYAATYARIDGFHSNTIQHANSNEWATGDLELLSIEANSPGEHELGSVRQHADMTVSVRVRTPQRLPFVTFGIGLHTNDFVYLVTDHSHLAHTVQELPAGEHVVECRFKSVPFAPGTYALRMGAAVGDTTRTIFYAENLCSVHVLAADDYNAAWQEGAIVLETEWLLPASNPVGAPREPVSTEFRK